MTVPSTVERNLLSQHPHRTNLYLSIYRPSVAFACQVNGVYDAINQSVDYDNVTEGVYTNITAYDYQVALIGTTPGDDDVGRTWVRSAISDPEDGDKIYFVESGHIDWEDDLYITVLYYTEIIPVFPRIIQDPADDEDVIFYKVWDIPYTNENEILGTFICMGSNYAGFISGSATVYFSASGTFNLLEENLTYAWTFENGTPATSADHTPGNVTWNTPGHHRVTLNVTSASGRIDRSIRYVSLYQRPGVGPNMPVLNWELLELSGSREGVGYSARIRVRQSVDRDDVMDGALVIIFKDDWYGSTQQSISKNDRGRENILFVGYLNGDTIHQNYQDNYVEFEVLSPTNLMELTECFSVSVESVLAPTEWYELINMDVRRAVYHYLAWHSSVLRCCDVEAKNLNDRYIQFFDADRTSLYDAINSVVDGALHGRVISDSLGKIWLEQDVSVIQGASGVLPISQTLYKSDWIETPVIEERQIEEVAFIESGGIAFSVSGSSSSPYLAAAPGTAPAYHGRVERVQGFAVSSQSDLNILTGNLYASWNARYPNVEMKLRGNFANLDIAPQEQVRLNIAAADTPRGIVFTNKAFAIRGLSWTWDGRSQILNPTVTLMEVTQGFAATSIIIPVEPPDTNVPGGGGGGGGVVTPPLPPPIFPPVLYSGTVNIFDEGDFVISTSNINFIGSVVRVYANTAQGRADIMVDPCSGCSGTP